MSSPFSYEIKDKIIKEQNQRCGVCKSDVLPLEVHHIVPESLLGLSTRELGIGVCHFCHRDLDRLVFDDGITPLGPLTELPDKFFRGNKNPFKGIKIKYGQMKDELLFIARKQKKQIKKGI